MAIPSYRVAAANMRQYAEDTGDETGLVMHPVQLPLAPDLPSRLHMRVFSEFKLGTGTEIPVRSMVFFGKETGPLATPDGICLGDECPMGPECCHKWPNDLTVENLIVVSTTSGNGEWIFGWFVRFDCKPQHLFKVPTHYVRLLARRFNRLTANPTEVRVMTEFREVVLVRPDLDFVAVADVRFQRRGLALTREVRTSKKRKTPFVPQPYVDEHEGESGPGSPPSSPEREAIDSCPICMEEGQVLLGLYCCKAGMACESCARQMRGLCSICDRDLLHAHYRCAHCANEVKLSEYGYPCSDCGKNVLCVTCFYSWNECLDCDPLG